MALNRFCLASLFACPNGLNYAARASILIVSLRQHDVAVVRELHGYRPPHPPPEQQRTDLMKAIRNATDCVTAALGLANDAIGVLAGGAAVVGSPLEGPGAPVGLSAGLATIALSAGQGIADYRAVRSSC
jgi:hypothetical protein